jgi:hypothetical protein
MAHLVRRVTGEGEGTGSSPPLVDLFPLFFFPFASCCLHPLFLLFAPPIFLFAFISFTAFILRHLIYLKA